MSSDDQRINQLLEKLLKVSQAFENTAARTQHSIQPDPDRSAFPLPVEQPLSDRSYPNIDDEQSLKLRGINQHLEHRIAIQEAFGSELFNDPVWNILLELLRCELLNTSASVKVLCIASGVPDTTALRWLGILEEKGLIERQNDPSDKRRIYVRLSRKAAARMSDLIWF